MAYTRGDVASLPTTDADLSTSYAPADYAAVSANDGETVAQTAETQYAVHQYKDFAGANTKAVVRWIGRVQSGATPVVMEIYNYSTETWVELARHNDPPAGVDFTLEASLPSLTDYLNPDNATTTCRVYQGVM